MRARRAGRPSATVYPIGSDAIARASASRAPRGAGKVRINSAGCLDRCQLGPVIVIYPDETWYTYVDRDDLDEIIDRHLVGGQTVKRLLVDQSGDA